MKKILYLYILLTLSACLNKGESNKILNGTEDKLPNKLKGLEVYNVGLGGGDVIRVALLNDTINSLSYTINSGEYETTETVIMLKNIKKQKVIIAKSIIYENDSIIIIRIK